MEAGARDHFQNFPIRAGEGIEDDGRAVQLVMVEKDGAVLACFRVMLFGWGAGLSKGYAARFYDVAPLSGYARPIADAVLSSREREKLKTAALIDVTE